MSMADFIFDGCCTKRAKRNHWRTCQRYRITVRRNSAPSISRGWLFSQNYEIIEAETYIYVSKLTIISSENYLSPGRRKAIIWTNHLILLMRTIGTNFSETLNKILTFSFKKMHLKMSSAQWRQFYLGFNVLINTLWPARPSELLGEYHEFNTCGPFY